MASRASIELKAKVARTLRRLYRVASADAPKLDEGLNRVESSAQALLARSSAMEQELAYLRTSLPELAANQLGHLDAIAQVLSTRFSAVEQELASLQSSLAELTASHTRHYSLTKAQYDDIARRREQLRALRRTKSYRTTFDNRSPS